MILMKKDGYIATVVIISLVILLVIFSINRFTGYSVNESYQKISFSPNEDVVANGLTECSDGVDNDGDGLLDWQYDLGCYGKDDANERALSREQEGGWTTYDPSNETKIVYVSSSKGNDGFDGLYPEPLNSSSGPVKTIKKGYDIMNGGYGSNNAPKRDGKPDWLLLKRGDKWEESIYWGVRSGKSNEERVIVASYGSSINRPLLIAPQYGTGFSICCGWHANLTLMGIDFYAAYRDPTSPMFNSTAGGGGFSRCCSGGGNLLIEDCVFRNDRGVVIQTGDGKPVNIEVRRNIMTDHYSEGSHSQGLYSSAIDKLLIEENIMDKNGYSDDFPNHERHLVVAHQDIGKWRTRSEERREGKECRSRWSPYH